MKSGRSGIRTHAVQKEGCAERIAPIGTLSQNGYGEDVGTHKRSMGTPDVTKKEKNFPRCTAASLRACTTCEKPKKKKKQESVTSLVTCPRVYSFLLASARTQETAIRNFAVEHREPGVLAGLTDARVQWPAHRHERVLRDRPPTPAR